MNSDEALSQLQGVIQDALLVLKGLKDPEVAKVAARLRRGLQGKVACLPVPPGSSQLLQEVAGLLGQVINAPSCNVDLPPYLKPYPALDELYGGLVLLRQGLSALVQGDLSQEIHLKGYLAGALKSLQANLRHLTWQTQMIASGDFSQRVDFMGKFSEAFNAMVVQLDESLQALKAKEADLTRINRELRDEVELRKKTEESLRQSEELYRQLSITDPLTGIFNRRRFYELAMSELQRTCRYGRSLAVIMMDVDHFKQVNDRYGHAVGDRVLQTLAASVRSCLRVVDIFARYGGEEFIVLLPETDLQTAGVTAERLRRNIAGRQMDTDQGQIKITISLGANAFSPPVQTPSPTPETLDYVINFADQALYEAKRSGRNRVILSDPGVPPSS
jgi:diguanylate cyclase (GGDEF)-like protein